jgi:hypothetical protein
LCHAKHVYNEKHINSIIQISSLDALNTFSAPRLPVFSTSSGKPFKVETAKELFHQIIEEILTQAIQWDKVSNTLVHTLAIFSCMRNASHTLVILTKSS